MGLPAEHHGTGAGARPGIGQWTVSRPAEHYGPNGRAADDNAMRIVANACRATGVRTVLLAGLVLSLPGCFRMRVAVRLDADGSGMQRADIRLSDQLLDRLRRTAQALDSGGPEQRVDPTRLLDRERVGEDLRERGLELTEHRVERDGARQDLAVAARFGEVAALRRSPLMGGETEWFVLEGRNPGGIRIVVYPRGHTAWRDRADRIADLLAAPDDLRRQFFEGQKERLQTLDLIFELELPGAIDYVSRGLEIIGEKTVRAHLRGADLRSAEDVVRMMAPRFEVEFDGAGCALPLDASDPGVPATRPAASPTRGDG